MRRNLLLLCLCFILASAFLVLHPRVVQADENNDVIKIYLRTGTDYMQPEENPHPAVGYSCSIGDQSDPNPKPTVYSDNDGLCTFKFPKGSLGNNPVPILWQYYPRPGCFTPTSCVPFIGLPAMAFVTLDENRDASITVYSYFPSYYGSVPEFSFMTGAG